MVVKQRIYIAIALLLGIAVASILRSAPIESALPHSFKLPRKPGVVSQCPAQIVSSSKTQPLHPTQVVVKPWKGRHHVYAYFVVPPGYRPSPFFEVAVGDAKSYCGRAQVSRTTSGQMGAVSSEHQVVKGWLRTRTAMWLVLNGKTAELAQPRNWLLQVEKRS
jgi:hypothetical protein